MLKWPDLAGWNIKWLPLDPFDRHFFCSHCAFVLHWEICYSTSGDNCLWHMPFFHYVTSYLSVKMTGQIWLQINTYWSIVTTVINPAILTNLSIGNASGCGIGNGCVGVNHSPTLLTHLLSTDHVATRVGSSFHTCTFSAQFQHLKKLHKLVRLI